MPALIVVIVAICGGCVMRQPAAPSRLDDAVTGHSDINWPDRALAPAARAAASAPTWRPGEPVPTEANGVPGEYIVTNVEAAGQGIVRELARLSVADERIDLDRKYLHYLSWSRDDDPAVDEAAAHPIVSPIMVLFSPSVLTVELAEPSRQRGLVVHLESLVGTRYEDAVIDELHERGWNTVTMPFLVQLEQDLEAEVESEEVLPAVAQLAAEYLDERAASRAYTVEAIVEYLERAAPEVRADPLVIVGFSAGALAAPTVTARIIDRVDAAVIVTGGANLLDISLDNEMGDAGFKVQWASSSLRRRLRDDLVEQYLEQSELDAYHTAPVLRSIPVLMLQGIFDAVVPARNGGMLYDRLGRPARWKYFGGHGLVFWRLPSEAKRIADWIDGKTNAGATAE